MNENQLDLSFILYFFSREWHDNFVLSIKNRHKVAIMDM